MRVLVIAALLSLVGCSDPAEVHQVKKALMEGFGSTARVDIGLHNRLSAIESALKITPAPEDVEEIEAIINGIRAYESGQTVE